MLTWNISPPDKDNIVRTPGIETGKVEWWYSIPNSISQLKEGNIIVLKMHGGMFWASRGEQRYSGTRFMVLRIKEIKEHPQYNQLFVCEEVVEFPVRNETKNKKPCDCKHAVHEGVVCNRERRGARRFCSACIVNHDPDNSFWYLKKPQNTP